MVSTKCKSTVEVKQEKITLIKKNIKHANVTENNQFLQRHYLGFMRVGTDFGGKVGHLADVSNHCLVGLALHVSSCGRGGL